MEVDAKAEALMRLIFTLKQNKIQDPRILKAVESIDRSIFIDGIFKDRAFEDIPLPIFSGQTISAPSIVAKMTEALEVNNTCKVLEIGAGSGYQAAILSRLARRVYTVERIKTLAKFAESKIRELNISNVVVVAGDGSHGLELQAPFDRILLTACADDVPSTLLAQLKLGGIMVLPVGSTDTNQTLLKVIKTEEGLEYKELGDVRFVPLLPGKVD